MSKRSERRAARQAARQEAKRVRQQAKAAVRQAKADLKAAKKAARRGQPAVAADPPPSFDFAAAAAELGWVDPAAALLSKAVDDTVDTLPVTEQPSPDTPDTPDAAGTSDADAAPLRKGRRRLGLLLAALLMLAGGGVIGAAAAGLLVVPGAAGIPVIGSLLTGAVGASSDGAPADPSPSATPAALPSASASASASAAGTAPASPSASPGATSGGIETPGTSGWEQNADADALAAMQSYVAENNPSPTASPTASSSPSAAPNTPDAPPVTVAGKQPPSMPLVCEDSAVCTYQAVKNPLKVTVKRGGSVKVGGPVISAVVTGGPKAPKSGAWIRLSKGAISTGTARPGTYQLRLATSDQRAFSVALIVK